jgi:hypothetical protein
METYPPPSLLQLKLLLSTSILLAIVGSTSIALSREIQAVFAIPRGFTWPREYVEGGPQWSVSYSPKNYDNSVIQVSLVTGSLSLLTGTLGAFESMVYLLERMWDDPVGWHKKSWSPWLGGIIGLLNFGGWLIAMCLSMARYSLTDKQWSPSDYGSSDRRYTTESWTCTIQYYTLRTEIKKVCKEAVSYYK